MSVLDALRAHAALEEDITGAETADLLDATEEAVRVLRHLRDHVRHHPKRRVFGLATRTLLTEADAALAPFDIGRDPE